MSENFPNLKETNIKIQEAQRLNPNSLTPRHIIIKGAKVREDSKGSKRKAKC